MRDGLTLEWRCVAAVVEGWKLMRGLLVNQVGVAAVMWELELGVGGADPMGRVKLTVEKMCTLRMLEWEQVQPTA